MHTLLERVRRHKAGEPVGLYAICSAHPVVIEVALREGLRAGQPVLVEATSNQVNQFGGYTGMTPSDFIGFVWAIAERVGFPREQLLFGGDHLGPNCWQARDAGWAMAQAELMIDQYVAAGFRKIHLDCSMACQGDPVPLPEALAAERAARLCAVAERAWARAGGEPPVYVIGTEVPVPGGAQESLAGLAVTEPSAARQTLQAHRDAFAQRGLQETWPRVIGLVVQPGVEFDHHQVIDYLPAKASALSRFIESEPTLVYEAHSTDYQTPANLQALVRDHFAILKVGPGATFALREGLWALADIAHEWRGAQGSAALKQVVLGVMQAEPAHWQKYYHDTEHPTLDMQFSLSDRIRYYWPHPQVQQACQAMLASLGDGPLPLTLLSQYLPTQYAHIRAGQLANRAADILRDSVATALRPYIRACAPEATAARFERRGEPCATAT
jgi:D-tagatose-1,6-bisphosphate aldolase subunit GatZ/KbaZ